ncbi:DNA topoisomerase IB [Aquimarina sp. MMG016]|uniref:DNA topoisomerase IB n=1 Tax=Aquimarina sp. MMG016 TaxID=2822690 RepID=UPI001B39ECB5|nr:DNA topoisomerase IB [Aquimarina sp. MMG016]MBQ4820550.1 DNA topoisomerase IB [Aquimarina sp. MMG016]
MGANITNPKFLKQIIKTPEKVIDQLDLVYVNDDKLTILRQKKGKDFIYLLNGDILSTKRDIKRIESLVIPPAWENVRIAALDNGHLQAIGRDLKNRKQYRYHPLWKAIRNQTKFYKMSDFGKQLPKIRKQVDKDLEQEGWPKRKVLALIIRLMEETHIRIGNEQYAKRNKTYGLSTMRTRHLHVEKDKMKFQFVGKKGKKHSVTLRNKKLMRLVNRCEEIPGWELFQYYDDQGIKHSVESSMINEYLHNIGGELFTAKDFRTWGATTISFEKLMELGITDNEKEIHKNILKAYDAAAQGLGNTRNVCRKYYVHPAIISGYEDGTIDNYFDQIDNKIVPKKYFSNTEQAILKILNNYTPEFLKLNN